MCKAAAVMGDTILRHTDKSGFQSFIRPMLMNGILKINQYYELWAHETVPKAIWVRT